MELHTEIEIAATPETVWSILVDLDRYADWNPFIEQAFGDVEVGEYLTVRIRPDGGRASTFKPTVTAVEPNRRFEWLGRIGIPGMFEGRHRFELEPSGEGTRFVQAESFSGVLVPLLSRPLNGGTRRGFEAMNRAIKDRAEGLAGTNSGQRPGDSWAVGVAGSGGNGD